MFKDIMLTRKPLAGFVLIGLAWAAFFAQMPAIKAQIGASDAIYGSVFLVASGGALLAMWLAPFTERYLGRWGMAVAGLCVGLGMLGAGFSHNIIVFGMSMWLASMGAGVVDVLINVRVSEIETKHDRAFMNLVHALYSFAYALSAFGAGLLREAGWSPAEVFSAMMLLFVGLCAAMVPKRSVEIPDMTSDAPPGLPMRLVWIAGLIVMVSFLTESASEGWSALHLERTLGGGPAEAALGPAILGLTMGVGRLSGYLFGHRFRDMQVMRAGCLMAVAGLVLVAVAPAVTVAYAGFALTGLGVSVVAPLALACLGRSVPARDRLVAITKASVLGYAAFFVGPPMMGITSEYFGLRTGFLLVAVILLVSALLLLPALRRQISRTAG
ncbi:MAG: MFS transporter [Roseobacter sp.]